MDDRKISLLMCTTVAGTLRAFLLPYALHFRELGWRVDAAAQGVSASIADIFLHRNLYDHQTILTLLIKVPDN